MTPAVDRGADHRAGQDYSFSYSSDYGLRYRIMASSSELQSLSAFSDLVDDRSVSFGFGALRAANGAISGAPGRLAGSLSSGANSWRGQGTGAGISSPRKGSVCVLIAPTSPRVSPATRSPQLIRLPRCSRLWRSCGERERQNGCTRVRYAVASAHCGMGAPVRNRKPGVCVRCVDSPCEAPSRKRQVPQV